MMVFVLTHLVDPIEITTWVSLEVTSCVVTSLPGLTYLTFSDDLEALMFKIVWGSCSVDDPLFNIIYLGKYNDGSSIHWRCASST
jgi:hypothetical protein